MPAAKIPAQGRGNWVCAWRKDDEFYEHWWGKPWHEAAYPKESHNCLAQTRGAVRVGGLPLMMIARCACGAVNLHDGEGWQDRNSRKRLHPDS